MQALKRQQVADLERATKGVSDLIMSSLAKAATEGKVPEMRKHLEGMQSVLTSHLKNVTDNGYAIAGLDKALTTAKVLQETLAKTRLTTRGAATQGVS